MRRAAFASAVATMMGGCQVVAGLPPPFAPAAAPAVLASNESYWLGREALTGGDNGLAERYFRKAVEANGDDGPSWVGLAAAYDNLKRFDLADRAYEQAVRIEGETLPILNNRGYSLLLRGDRAGALKTFRLALSLFPGTPVIQNNIALARSGQRPNRAVAP